MTENRRSHQDPMSVLNRNADLLSVDICGGQEMMAILEKDDIQEDASADTIQMKGK